mmetsp:Transcript_66831/g.159480  ORF Transcript_66831/g.159480 Transcript_66831/m.159480 type:complete len:219 (-) Transcript_66831:214-870(-)
MALSPFFICFVGIFDLFGFLVLILCLSLLLIFFVTLFVLVVLVPLPSPLSIVVIIIAIFGFVALLRFLFVLHFLERLFKLLQILQIIFQDALIPVQLPRLLQGLSLWNLRHRDVANGLLSHQPVNKLVHADDGHLAVHVPVSQLAIVCKKRLQCLENGQIPGRDSEVGTAQSSQILELWLLDVLHHNFLLRLNLQQLQKKAQKPRRPAPSTVSSSDIV